MEEDEGAHDAYQSASSLLISGAARPRVRPPPVLSPSSINICRAYHERSRDTQMDYFEEDDAQMVYFEEDDADEEDFDYEEEEEQEDDDEEEDEEDNNADEEEGVETIDMGTFSEPGRKFLSKVWKEYEPIRVDNIVVAAECKHCARNIRVERKHGASSLRKHLKRCKERRKLLRVSGKLSASIVSPDGVSMGLWTFNQALARRELMRMIVLHELAFSLVEYDGFRTFVSSLNPNFKMICRKTKRIVKFIAMETPHKGVVMFNVMVNFIRDWNIEDKIFYEMWKVKLTLDQQHYEEGTEFGDVVLYMKRKLKKYWRLSWVNICIPVILGPQFKLKYLEFRFGSEFGNDAAAMINKIKGVFQGLFNEYIELDYNGSDPTTQGPDDDMDASNQDPMADWDKHVTLSAPSTNIDSSELDSYLAKVPIRRSD
ncbi:unnamed protein product [Alopecurus aequalis]